MNFWMRSSNVPKTTLEDDFTKHQQTEHYSRWRDVVKDWMTQPRVGLKHKSISSGDGEG